MNVKHVVPIKRRETFIAMVLSIALLASMSPTIIYKYNFFYRLAFPVAGLVLIILKRNVVNIIMSRNFRPLMLCLIIFTLFFIIAPEKYGKNCSITYMRGSILFICGFILRNNPKYFLGFVVAICVILVVLSYQMMGGGLTSQHFFSRSVFILAAAANMGLGSSEGFKEVLTNFVWYISFAGLLLASLFDSKSKWLRFVSVSLFLSILFFSVRSMWTTPVLILVFGFGIIVISVANNRQGRISVKQIRKFFIAGLAVFIVISIVVTISNQSTSGEAEVKFNQLNLIFSRLILGQGNFSEWDSATSGRLRIIPLSVNAFLDSPLIGGGNFFKISGHSALIDAFAKFGLLGGVPVVLILIFYMRLALSLAKKELEFPYTMSACFSLFTMFFVISFLNPIFMTANSEGLFFVVAGFVSGRNSL